MAAKQTRSTKPEERELARKCKEQERLEAELAECELRLATLRGELKALEARYLHMVGARYAELDELRAQIAERLSAEEPENERLQRAAREARARANESRGAVPLDEPREHKPFSPSPELKRMYREAAKRIHPDLTANANDRARRQELMAEVNNAYQQGDESGIAKILEVYESSPEAVQGEGPGAELVRVIRKLSSMNNRLVEIEAEMQILMNSDLYLLKIQADDAQVQSRDLLAEMADKVRQRIADSKARMEVFTPGRVH
ncbi:MAG: J domain-containing protein [Candidatus Acidiferrales bacterium]